MEPFDRAGWDPYGQRPAADQGYGYGPPGVPYAPVDNSSAIAALACNAVATLLCCNVLCVGGIVTAAIAMSKAPYDPARAHNLMLWSWVVLGTSLLLEIILIGVLLALGGVFADSGGPPGGTPAGAT